MRAWLQGLLAAAAMAAMTAPGAAQQVGDPVAGAALSRQWCANCHVVAPGQAATPGTGDAAPTFPAIAAMTSTTALSLRAFLQQPHRRMPDWNLTRTQTDDVIAYILSLRGQ